MATAIEYGLVAALIAVAGIGAMETLGGKLKTPDALENASNATDASDASFAPKHPEGVRPALAEVVVRDGVAYARSADSTRCYEVSFNQNPPVMRHMSCSAMPQPG